MVIGDDGSEARLRDRAGRYSLTIKSAGMLSRGEWPLELTDEQFAYLWPATDGKRLEKTRYDVPCGRSLIELDVYGGHLAGLIIAEVEFDSERDAEDFQPPAWFGAEVTMDRLYKNQQLALNGLPAVR